MVNEKKYVLLDRDGTINLERKDYVKSFSEFIFLEGSIKALNFFCDNGFNIIIITNQSPIGRGLISHEDLASIHNQMKKELSNYNIEILDIFYCPALPESNDFNRKPNPGMLLECAERYKINLSETYFIGDSKSDMMAGHRAGCNTLLVNEKYTLIDAAYQIVYESN